MVRTNLSLFDNFNQLTPYAVGFDRVFDQLQNYVENNKSSSGYPPYNIRKEGEFDFNIQMALAGFSKNDIEVEVANNVLTIRSVKENNTDHWKPCLTARMSSRRWGVLEVRDDG